MDLNTTTNELDDKNRSALLKIIDFKTEENMEKVLAKMDAKFAQMDSKFAHVEAGIATVRWVVIVGGGLIGLILTIIATK